MSDDVAKRDLRFGDEKALEEWLNTQPREVSVIIAARAALRVLPILAKELPAMDAGRFTALISVCFRATALARVAAKYPTRANELAAYAYAADAAAAAAAAANAAATAAAYAAYAAAAAAANAAAAWEALSNDANFLSKGDSVAELADHPLWPDATPRRLVDLWTKLKAALPLGEDWEVWNGWYDERLFNIRSRGEAYELVFATVPVEVWEEGPAAANRWIKEHLPPPPPTVKPLENIPCAFAFGWSTFHKINVVAGPQNQPIFPFAVSEADHKQWLETSRVQVGRLLADLRAGRLNLRPDYLESLERYEADLPSAPGLGNFVLADQEARFLRDLFAAEADFIPAPFALRLKGILQQHIALRGFYPEVERLYSAIQKGHLEKPLPWDNVEAFGRTIRENTPDKFEPEVSRGLQEVERLPPVIELQPEDIRRDSNAILPPPDPLGEVKPENSRSFSVASVVNGVMKVVTKGKDVSQAWDGWQHVAHKLGEDAAPVIEWLRDNFPQL